MKNLSTAEYAKNVRLLKINELQNLINLNEKKLKYFPDATGFSANIAMLIEEAKNKLIERIANQKAKLITISAGYV